MDISDSVANKKKNVGDLLDLDHVLSFFAFLTVFGNVLPALCDGVDHIWNHVVLCLLFLFGSGPG